MTRMYDVYSITLTEANIPKILEVTKPLGWTLDHLQDNMEYNAEDGFETMLFMKLFMGTTEIATFTEDAMDEADAGYRQTDTIDPLFGIFYKIEKI